MPLAGFEVAVDKFGHHGGDLSPSGGTLNIATSNVANGGYLPGDLTAIETTLTIIRITATKDVYLRFSNNGTSATSSDILFLAGTERMQLPEGDSYVSAITRDAAETGILSVTIVE